MKLFYFGGQKSGKTSCASKRALEIALNKPYYVATYDNSYNDKSMQERIKRHQIERQDDFISLFFSLVNLIHQISFPSTLLPMENT